MEMKAVTKMEKRVDEIKSKINQLKNKMSNIIATEHVKESGINQREEMIEKEIREDEKLDKSRDQETELTSNLIKKSGGAYVKKIMGGSEGLVQNK